MHKNTESLVLVGIVALRLRFNMIDNSIANCGVVWCVMGVYRCRASGGSDSDRSEGATAGAVCRMGTYLRLLCSYHSNASVQPQRDWKHYDNIDVLNDILRFAKTSLG